MIVIISVWQPKIENKMFVIAFRRLKCDEIRSDSYTRLTQIVGVN